MLVLYYYYVTCFKFVLFKKKIQDILIKYSLYGFVDLLRLK